MNLYEIQVFIPKGNVRLRRSVASRQSVHVIYSPRQGDHNIPVSWILSNKKKRVTINPATIIGN